MPRYRVFVSYSRKDSRYVTPVVEMLQSIEVVTFFDKTSIKGGDDWDAAITNALRRVRHFLLFWCSHASQSRAVKREYTAAQRLRKRVIPVILDGTELPANLQRIEYLNFRKLAASGHRTKRSATKARTKAPFRVRASVYAYRKPTPTIPISKKVTVKIADAILSVLREDPRLVPRVRALAHGAARRYRPPR